ncbi:hypothetical protein [Nonomuraea sp. B19D2]|uniref:hypothetical protein n=1 Tax=Nonomuraea sp. B19D2 TaxID=3159561 RepID=UPI0032DACBE5
MSPGDPAGPRRIAGQRDQYVAGIWVARPLLTAKEPSTRMRQASSEVTLALLALSGIAPR